jgi:predicted SAM-dependent methyltransferase
MIVADVDSYLARAVHVAHHPDELAALRRRLAANREQMPLFDVQRFARHLESAYEAVWARYCRGEAPVTLNTPALPGRLPARPTPVSVAPATPQKDRSGLVQLHVEGSEAKEGWTIIGARPGPGVDRVSDPRHLAEFAQDSVDAIYASWFYQRLSHREELPAALASAWRVLKPGGTLRLAVPDFQLLSALMGDAALPAAERFTVMALIFGDQTGPDRLNRAGLTVEFLGAFLKRAGFRTARRVRSFGLFNDRSNAALQGRAVSLNIEAAK